MAITGSASLNVGEAALTTVELLKRLGGSNDMSEWQIIRSYEQLAQIGEGRLYMEPPATVTFVSLISLANQLAEEAGHESVYLWEEFWALDGAKGRELNGSLSSWAPRLAKYSVDQDERHVHFAGLPYDKRYARRGEATQLGQLKKLQANFSVMWPGATLQIADHRAFLVWYIMDLLRGVPTQDMALSGKWMRSPGRHAMDGCSYIGAVCVRDGRAGFGGHLGDARVDASVGIGISVGLRGV